MQTISKRLYCVCKQIWGWYRGHIYSVSGPTTMAEFGSLCSADSMTEIGHGSMVPVVGWSLDNNGAGVYGSYGSKNKGRIIRHRASLFEKTLFFETQGQNLTFIQGQARSRGYLRGTCCIQSTCLGEKITLGPSPMLHLFSSTHCVISL